MISFLRTKVMPQAKFRRLRNISPRTGREIAFDKARVDIEETATSQRRIPDGKITRRHAQLLTITRSRTRRSPRQRFLGTVPFPDGSFECSLSCKLRYCEKTYPVEREFRRNAYRLQYGTASSRLHG